MNTVAGAYAEQVPLVVLVGGPRTTQRRSPMLLHHGVGLALIEVMLDRLDTSDALKRLGEELKPNVAPIAAD
jgi:TPP-dependent 2-oxoacid decarboxylase